MPAQIFDMMTCILASLCPEEDLLVKMKDRNTDTELCALFISEKRTNITTQANKQLYMSFKLQQYVNQNADMNMLARFCPLASCATCS